jgi:hypothetical protein
MDPVLTISQMSYRRDATSEWRQSCDMLLASQACEYLKAILGGKVSRRGAGTRRFFGEAYVATQIAHTEGYYGSFQWLTSQMFLGERPFPESPTRKFQSEYRSALQRHFPGQLEPLQRSARLLEAKTGVRPAAPDLWLVEASGRHRFVEVKLPEDEVSDSQIAGLAVIARTFGAGRDLSVEIIELRPDRAGRFSEFLQELDRTG